MRSVCEVYIHTVVVFRFSTKESATHAIVSVHNNEINGQPVKCSWGKESGDPNNTPVTTQVMVSTTPVTTQVMVSGTLPEPDPLYALEGSATDNKHFLSGSPVRERPIRGKKMFEIELQSCH